MEVEDADGEKPPETVQPVHAGVGTARVDEPLSRMTDSS
jgi:hypothetical protein